MISLKNEKNLKKNQKMTYTKTLNIKKIEHPYIEPQVQDAETIEKERKKEDDEFFDLDKKYNKIDNAATKKKKERPLYQFV